MGSSEYDCKILHHHRRIESGNEIKKASPDPSEGRNKKFKKVNQEYPIRNKKSGS